MRKDNQDKTNTNSKKKRNQIPYRKASIYETKWCEIKGQVCPKDQTEKIGEVEIQKDISTILLQRQPGTKQTEWFNFG